METVKNFFNDRVRLGVLAVSTLLIYLTALWSPGLIIALVQMMALPVAVISSIIVGVSVYKEYHLFEGDIDLARRDLNVKIDDIINLSDEQESGPDTKE